MEEEAPATMQSEKSRLSESKEQQPVKVRPKRARRKVQPFVSNKTMVRSSNEHRTQPGQRGRQRTLIADTTKKRVGRPRSKENSANTASRSLSGRSRSGDQPSNPVSNDNSLRSANVQLVARKEKDGLEPQKTSVSPIRNRGRPPRMKESESSSNERRSPRKRHSIHRLGMAHGADYYLEDEEDQLEEHPPRRKHGRPLKTGPDGPLPTKTTMTGVTNRNRDGSQKILDPVRTPVPVQVPVSNALLSDSRRSGRKRQRTDRLGMADDDDYSLEELDEVYMEEKPKRKRGRPRNPNRSASDKPRRGRGRPPKNPATLPVTIHSAGATTNSTSPVAGADLERKCRVDGPILAAATIRSTSAVASLDQPPRSHKHWADLKYAGLVSDYIYGKFIPLTFGTSLESAISAVQEGLDEIEDSAGCLPDSDPYIVEAKMYQRSMKERQQRSDGERIEKLRHREEYENRLREYQYKSRGRKRSPYEAELDEICLKPIEITEATRESSRIMICKGGSDCRLCGQPSRIPKSSEEQMKASRRVPAFRLSRITDSWVETRLEDEEVELTKRQSRSRRRQTRDSSKTQNTIDILTEMKHSLDFLKRYNEGYL